MSEFRTEPAGEGVTAERYLAFVAELDAREAAGEAVDRLYDQLDGYWDAMAWEERRKVNRALAGRKIAP